MKTITIKTQSELDALPEKFDSYTIIELRTTERIIVRRTRGNSSVEAWENSSVVAGGNSSVVARENSSVVARGNSSVEAWGNSSVEAWENSSVEAWENSSVVAWGNSSVVARENSSVVAWGNSSVEAWGNVCVRAQSDFASIALFMFAVCYALSKAKIQKKAETATIITPAYLPGAENWLASQGVKIAKNNTVILFKRVSESWLTQEGTQNETAWTPGSMLEHSAWNPTKQECGGGKFHFCSRPYFCDEFRSDPSDKYIALELSVADLFAWENPTYLHKIAGRKAKVLYRCDKQGKEIKAEVIA